MIGAALGVLLGALVLAALYLGDSPPEARALENAYSPFSVETQIRDR